MDPSASDSRRSPLLDASKPPQRTSHAFSMSSWRASNSSISDTRTTLALPKTMLSGALPQLTEDPRELESQHFHPTPWATFPEYPITADAGVQYPTHRSPGSLRRDRGSADKLGDWDLDRTMSAAKRRRTSEFRWSGWRSTLDSFSKRSRLSKHVPLSTVDCLSPPPSPRRTSTSRSRSASQAHSIRASEDAIRVTGLGIDTIMEDDGQVAPDDGRQLPRSRTPLLPLFHNDAEHKDLVESPLQSPTVASTAQYAPSPASLSGTPRLMGMMTPPLSTQPSMSSFGRSRTNTGPGSSDLPSLSFTGSMSSDRWGDLLGHANFCPTPEPYLPATSDAATRGRYTADWTEARADYLRHRAGTEKHFGASSMIYIWTEEKWTSIDAQWRECSEIIARRAVESGELTQAPLLEPAPLPTITSISDPRMVQSEHIVGPMEVRPAQEKPQAVTHQPSKAEQLLKLLIPKARLARSLSVKASQAQR